MSHPSESKYYATSEIYKLIFIDNIKNNQNHYIL